jgi:PAS domain S-box-containing protein
MNETNPQEELERLRAENAKLKHDLDANALSHPARTPIGGWLYDDESKTMAISGSVYRFLGLDPLTAAEDANELRIMPPEDAKRIRKKLDEAPKPSEVVATTARLRKHDGSLVEVFWRGVGVMERDGRTRRLIGEIAAINPDSEAHAAIMATTSSADVVAIHDYEGVVRYISPSAKDLFGYPPDQLVGVNAIDFVHPEDRSGVFDSLATLRGGAASARGEYRLRNVDDSYRWVESVAKPMPDEEGLVVNVVRDAQARKDLERSREGERQFFRDLFNLHSAPMILVDPQADGAIVDANEAAARFYDYSIAELRRLSVNDLNTMTPEEIKKEMNGAFSFSKNVFQFRHRLANGETRDVLVYSAPIPRGKKTLLFSIIHDVTETKRAQEALKNSFEQMKAVFDGMDAMVYVADMETYETLFVNKYGRTVWGDAVGKVCWQTMQEGMTGPCPFCNNNQLLNRDGAPGPPIKWEFKNTVTKRWYAIVDRAIRWTDGRLARLEIALDIEDRKAAERKLREQRDLLASVADAAQSLIFVKDFDHAATRALAALGAGANVDRAYVFENARAENGERILFQRYEWTAEGVEPQIDNPDLQGLPYDPDFLRWERTLEAGRAIVGPVEDYPEAEKEFLEQQGILSLLVVPIIDEDEFVGFIGFDDCKRPRLWSEETVNILKTSAAALGSRWRVEQKKSEEDAS